MNPRSHPFVSALFATSLFVGQGQAALLYYLNHENLPASGGIDTWDGATAIKSWQGDGIPLAGPEVVVINGEKWSRNFYQPNVGEPWNPPPGGPGGTWGKWTGYRVAAPGSAVAVNGATVIAAVIRGSAQENTPWTSVVDVMYDKLTLGIRNDTGQIVVRRNASLDTSVGTIDVGAAVVLSMTVQSDGAYTVWANDVEMLSRGSNGTMTSWDPARLTYADEPDWASTTGVQGNWDLWWAYVIAREPTVTAPWDWANFNALPNRDTYWGYDQNRGFDNNINVGRNEPDGWTAFNGDIGDVMIYDEALSDSTRLSLVSDMTVAMGIIPEPSLLGLLALTPALVWRRRRA